MSYRKVSGCEFKESDRIGGGSVSHIPRAAFNEARREVGDAIHVNVTGQAGLDYSLIYVTHCIYHLNGRPLHP